MRKINLKPIGDFIGQACEVALYGVAIAASCKVGKYITDELDKPPANYTYSYSDAVGAIMDSGMFSHYKTEAVEALKRYESADYYRAIVRIVKDSSMYSHDKVKMIKHLSEN